MKRYVRASNYRVYNENNGRYYSIDPNDSGSLREMLEDVGGRDFASQVVSILDRAIVTRDEVESIVRDVKDAVDESDGLVRQILERDDIPDSARYDIEAIGSTLFFLQSDIDDFNASIKNKESWG